MLAYLLSITKIDRNALLYVAAFSSVGFGYIGVSGVLGNLYVLGLGFDTTYLGTLTALGQLVWALSALPPAEVGARIGLRGTMISGYVGIAVCFAAYINVPLLPQQYWATGLMVTNLLMWVAVSLASVNGVPYLMSVVPEHERSKAFTLQAAVMPVAAFAGSLVGGFLPGLLMSMIGGLDETSAYRVALMLPVLSYLVSVGVLLKLRPAPPLIQAEKGLARQTAPLGLLVFMGLLFSVQIASEGSLLLFMNVYFNKDLFVSTSMIGTVFAVVRLLPFFASPLLPLLLNRWGAGLTMASSYVLLAISGIAMALFHNWIAAGAAFMLASLASGFAQPARSLFGQEAVQPRWRTTVNAVSTISLAVGSGLAGYTGGRLIDLAGFRGLFLISAAAALASVLIYAASRKKKPAQPVAVPEDVRV